MCFRHPQYAVAEDIHNPAALGRTLFMAEAQTASAIASQHKDTTNF
jgi:hypothetical protein